MPNRVTVSVAGFEYTLISDEDEASILKVADHIDSMIGTIRREKQVSLADAAVLAAANIAGEYFKASENLENLRSQIKGYIEDATRAKAELAEARRELSRYKK